MKYKSAFGDIEIVVDESLSVTPGDFTFNATDWSVIVVKRLSTATSPLLGDAIIVGPSPELLDDALVDLLAGYGNSK